MISDSKCTQCEQIVLFKFDKCNDLNFVVTSVATIQPSIVYGVDKYINVIYRCLPSTKIRIEMRNGSISLYIVFEG